jgi:inorganic pyrophosphatase
VLGAIECKTSEHGGGPAVRNDRVIAVPAVSIVGAEWRELGDIGARLVREIAEFLESYTRREGRQFTMLGTVERKAALELVRGAI